MRMLSLRSDHGEAVIPDPLTRAAFARSVKRGPPFEWRCSQGMHEPTFLLHTWACAGCGKALSQERTI